MERKKKSERYSFGILYMGYLLSIVKVKKEGERKNERKERRKRDERERGKREEKERKERNS